MVALQTSAGPPRRQLTTRRELYRELCQDGEGHPVTVIVWQNKPGLSTLSYSLEDGTPVHYEDECYFATPDGKVLTRCEA